MKRDTPNNRSHPPIFGHCSDCTKKILAKAQGKLFRRGRVVSATGVSFRKSESEKSLRKQLAVYERIGMKGKARSARARLRRLLEIYS